MVQSLGELHHVGGIEVDEAETKHGWFLRCSRVGC
jgi:hypothetical protein